MTQTQKVKARTGRPYAANPKRSVTVRYDAEVVDAFKATGKGWQTRMNNALRAHVSLARATEALADKFGSNSEAAITVIAIQLLEEFKARRAQNEQR